MARITISVSAEGEKNDQELVTLDVPLSLTLGEFKDVIASETKFPTSVQHIFHNGKAIRDDSQPLETAGIKDGDMLAMIVGRAQGQPVRSSGSRSYIPPPPDENRIEHIRQQIIASPEQLNALRSKTPALADVLHDPVRFRETWMSLLADLDREQIDKENEIRLLNDDPFNSDAQKRIQDIIRREKIQENLQYAYEHNPAVFVNVSMLYVHVLVNNHPIKAFVDSGAQSTIMSPGCAEACGISYLIDERYSGIAKGVGTARILGRVHNAKIQVGDAELDCAFTVMEGKDVDLLFGLDMLKRHQACIDLLQNKLRFPHTEVEFLPESDIPKREEERMLDELTVKGPNGTEIGMNSGSIRPQGTAEAAHHSLEQAKKAGESSTQITTGGAKPPPTTSEAVRRSQQPITINGPPSTIAALRSRFPEESIQQLMSIGVSREEAIRALEAAGGNVDYAAGVLFGG